MAHDPYSATADFGEHYADSGPPRTSRLAIVAFVLSILLIVGCVIPGAPAVVMILSVVALGLILRSQGKLKGMAFAVIALILSLLVSAIQLAVGYGAHMYVQSLGRSADTIKLIQNGNFTEARTRVSASVVTDLSDEKLAAFDSELRSRIGVYQKTPSGLLNYWNASRAGQKSLRQDQLNLLTKYILENAFSGTPVSLVPQRLTLERRWLC